MIYLDGGQRVARKNYHCSCCRAAIPKGSRYNYDVLKYDGHVYTWRTCLASKTGHCGDHIEQDDESATCEKCEGYV